MAKEIETFVKLQVKGGAANPAPPVGPALGSKGVNIMEFCKRFNAATQDMPGKLVPVESAMKMVAGTARSMGLTVSGSAPWENN